MATHLKKMNSDIAWGTQVALGNSLGIVLSCSTKSGGKVADITGGEGELASAVFHDQRETVTLEVLAGTLATKPALGSEINIGGVTSVIITESAVKWSNSQGKVFAFSGIKSVA